ncbi:flavin reductase family protein [Corynebacterium sp. CCM 9204]|uniref:flavin reductase family protein n=1 Tax=Corynebacterium sp. CCM 9204 TaxID=3057616 RepID=UPI0035244E27
MSSDALPAGEGLRTFFRGCASGVWIITTLAPDGAPVGFTASSVASVSLDPATLTFSLQAGSSSWPAVEAAEEVAIHALGVGDAALAQRFSTSGINRFEGVDHLPGPTGLPVIRGLGAVLRARILTTIPVGDSRLVLAQCVETYIAGDRPPPLIHSARSYWTAEPVHESEQD